MDIDEVWQKGTRVFEKVLSFLGEPLPGALSGDALLREVERLAERKAAGALGSVTPGAVLCVTVSGVPEGDVPSLTARGFADALQARLTSAWPRAAVPPVVVRAHAGPPPLRVVAASVSTAPRFAMLSWGEDGSAVLDGGVEFVQIGRGDRSETGAPNHVRLPDSSRWLSRHVCNLRWSSVAEAWEVAPAPKMIGRLWLRRQADELLLQDLAPLRDGDVLCVRAGGNCFELTFGQEV